MLMKIHKIKFIFELNEMGSNRRVMFVVPDIIIDLEVPLINGGIITTVLAYKFR